MPYARTREATHVRDRSVEEENDAEQDEEDVGN